MTEITPKEVLPELDADDPTHRIAIQAREEYLQEKQQLSDLKDEAALRQIELDKQKAAVEQARKALESHNSTRVQKAMRRARIPQSERDKIKAQKEAELRQAVEILAKYESNKQETDAKIEAQQPKVDKAKEVDQRATANIPKLQAAAARIQARARGNQARADYEKMRQNAAATKIQPIIRMRQAQKELTRRKVEHEQKVAIANAAAAAAKAREKRIQNAAATKLQGLARRVQAKKELDRRKVQHNKEIKSVTKIQSAFRRRMAQKRVAQMKIKNEAATKIQGLSKIIKAKKALKAKQVVAAAAKAKVENTAATKIQAAFRGHKGRIAAIKEKARQEALRAKGLDHNISVRGMQLAVDANKEMSPEQWASFKQSFNERIQELSALEPQSLETAVGFGVDGHTAKQLFGQVDIEEHDNKISLVARDGSVRVDMEYDSDSKTLSQKVSAKPDDKAIILAVEAQVLAAKSTGNPEINIKNAKDPAVLIKVCQMAKEKGLNPILDDTSKKLLTEYIASKMDSDTPAEEVEAACTKVLDAKYDPESSTGAKFEAHIRKVANKKPDSSGPKPSKPRETTLR